MKPNIAHFSKVTETSLLLMQTQHEDLNIVNMLHIHHLLPHPCQFRKTIVYEDRVHHKEIHIHNGILDIKARSEEGIIFIQQGEKIGPCI